MNQNNNDADSGASHSDAGLGVVCEHGQLKRSCDLCEKDAEIELLRELLRAAIPLLREVMFIHADPESSEYNECDTAPCMWCEMAARIVTPNAEITGRTLAQNEADGA